MAKTAAAPERLRLLHGHDLWSESGELGTEELALSSGAADEHAPHARVSERGHLVSGELALRRLGCLRQAGKRGRWLPPDALVHEPGGTGGLGIDEIAAVDEQRRAHGPPKLNEVERADL